MLLRFYIIYQLWDLIKLYINLGKEREEIYFCFAYVKDKEILGIIPHLIFSHRFSSTKMRKFKWIITNIQRIIIERESSNYFGWTDGKSKCFEIKKRIKKGLRDQVVCFLN